MKNNESFLREAVVGMVGKPDPAFEANSYREPLGISVSFDALGQRTFVDIYREPTRIDPIAKKKCAGIEPGA